MEIKRGTLHSYHVLALVVPVLLVLLLCVQSDPFAPAARAMPLPASSALGPAAERAVQQEIPIVFSGIVQYDPAAATARAQAGIPVTLVGFTDLGELVELGHTVSAGDGSFELATAPGAAIDWFEIRSGIPRGYTPGKATSGSGGEIRAPNSIRFPGTVEGEVGDNDFILFDPVVLHPSYHDRYLIVTSDAIVPVLDEFINYKQSLGFDVLVKTVEELDPGGVGGNYLRSQIRSHEQTLWEEQDSLKYVLLVGGTETVPFAPVNPAIPDRSRDPDRNWDKLLCRPKDDQPNNCGKGSDWYYVDLVSDWDSNGDGIIGELFWANPDKLQKWEDEDLLPAGYQPDEPPTFQPTVFAGRIPLDSPAAVQTALDAIMAFEQDGGPWKLDTLLAGAMASVGGLGWSNAKGKYVNEPAPTDAGYLMEAIWSDFLQPAGYQKVCQYEKESPYGVLPPRTSAFPVDDPLTRDNFHARWASQAFGLVQTSGHGWGGGVQRLYWSDDYNSNVIPEALIEPGAPHGGQGELGSQNFLEKYTVQALPLLGGKTPILVTVSCLTGQWDGPANIPASLLARGKLAGWWGGVDVLVYEPGWESPSNPDGGAQMIGYLISEALFGDNLPLGDAVWTGLANYFNWANGSQWTYKGSNKGGMLSWDLYGDPSANYWGNSAELDAPWPMFHYDWPGKGESALLGPYTDDLPAASIDWTSPIETAAGTDMPSPVVGDESMIYVGDSYGTLHAVAGNGIELWTYPTDGAIVGAPAVSRDGTIYVKAQDGTLHAISAAGTMLWADGVGDSPASPKIGIDGTVYVGGSDNDGPGGTARYFVAGYRPDGTRLGISLVDDIVTTTPTMARDGHRLWVGTAAGTVYSMTLGVASQAWSLTPGDAIGSGMALAEEDELLLVPSVSEELIAVDITTGIPSWTLTTDGPIRSAPAVGAGGQVIFGSQDGTVYAVELADGSPLWDYDTGGPVDSSPALDPLTAYVVGGSPSAVYAIDRSSGQLRWSIALGADATGGSSPAIGHGRMLYVVAGPTPAGPVDSALVAIGPVNWSLPPIPTLTTREPGMIGLEFALGDPLASIVVERRIPGDDWGVIATLEPGVTEMNDMSVTAGQFYQYRGMTAPVTTAQSQAEGAAPAATEASDYSQAVTVQALPELPETPPAPTVTPLSSTELRLTWTEPAANVISTEILRQGPGETVPQIVGSVPGGVLEYDDTDLEPASAYTYWLQAVNDTGTSPTSPSTTGTTLSRSLPAPGNVTVTLLQNEEFEVCWEPGDPLLHSVLARRDLGEALPGYMATVGPGETCYTDEFTYFHAFEYWVKHTNAPPTDESEWARSEWVAPPGYDWGYESIHLPLVMRGH